MQQTKCLVSCAPGTVSFVCYTLKNWLSTTCEPMKLLFHTPCALLGIVMQRLNGGAGGWVYSFARQSHVTRRRISPEILDGNILSDGNPKRTWMADLDFKQTKMAFKSMTMNKMMCVIVLSSVGCKGITRPGYEGESSINHWLWTNGCAASLESKHVAVRWKNAKFFPSQRNSYGGTEPCFYMPRLSTSIDYKTTDMQLHNTMCPFTSYFWLVLITNPFKDGQAELISSWSYIQLAISTYLILIRET